MSFSESYNGYNEEKNKDLKYFDKWRFLELDDDEVENLCIDAIINRLLEEKKKWKNFYCYVCGKKIYSCDINSLDDAYIIIYWKTKTEKENCERKNREELEKVQKKHLEDMKNISKWVNEWKKYIEFSKREEWEEHVNSKVRDPFYWNDIEIELKILKMLDEDKDINEVKREFNKYSLFWVNRSIVKTYIVYFSKKSEEFKEKVN